MTSQQPWRIFATSGLKGQPLKCPHFSTLTDLVSKIQLSFSSIVRSGRYVRSANILINAKCLPSAKSSQSAKNLPTTKCLAFANFLVKDKHLINGNLSNMTEVSS